MSSRCQHAGLAAVASGWALLSWASGHAYPAGPPAGVTGGFGEDTCVACHDSYELGAGREAGLGEVLIVGAPKSFQPAETYRLKVVVTHVEGRSAWGFQLSARVKRTGAQAGDLRSIDGTTRVLVANGIQYIEHTAEGIFSNAFEFDWSAPSEAGEEIVLHVAANAADGDGSSVGDYIYTTSVEIPPAGRRVQRALREASPEVRLSVGSGNAARR